jgi:hypothetical protein
VKLLRHKSLKTVSLLKVIDGKIMPNKPNCAPPGCYYLASSNAYLVDPAGTYSAWGASAPTADPVGAYSDPGASAPTPADAYIPLTRPTSSAATADPAGIYWDPGASAPASAPPGAYIPATGAISSAAAMAEPDGAYSAAGASAPTIGPVGTYSGAEASAPTLANPGTYIPTAGATSTAAEIVDPAGTFSAAGASAPTTDPAGTYSPAGASTPIADPAGTHSGAGASAPTEDRAGTYSNQYALDRLILDPGNLESPYQVLSFNSVTAVENYFGINSIYAKLAAESLAGYGSSANLLFVRYPVEGSRSHLFGTNISNMTLTQLQAISGSLSITSQGYVFSGSVNLAGVSGFLGAAVAIQNALNASLPVVATTTGSSIAPARADGR